ncbi:P-loop containing nucleoside triphosphate hydrolase protein [Flagelloscypha sp. PMI_526]|nr:P-loop containing nucleoside triphosphate hydrolase protein [Flagelloscypha sp. PMI_526]
MSKLNPGAFEFVPGRGFGAPPAAPAPAQPPVQQRQEATEAPAPAPTISLNIGGSPRPPPVQRPEATSAPAPAPTVSLNIGGKPAPASSASNPAASSASQPPSQPAVATKSKSDAAPSKTFTMDRSKTDTSAIAEEVAQVADESVLTDLYGDVKEHLNIVFIGHVDAGKSTMGGNLLYITGMVDKRTMEKYEKDAKEAGRESWYLSWALDSTPQERNKGKTVEVGRAYFETDARRYTILDAPGHKTFVPSMISGAAQADIAILVISARKGEFETGFERGGQTREHIMLVKTAGVSKVIIVINKMDDPTVNWDGARYNEIKDKLTPFARSAGFNPKTDITWIPVSAYKGVNLKDRIPAGLAPWYRYLDPSFLEFLDKMPMVDRKTNGPLMVPVSEKYKDMGTIVVGKIESGALRKGDSLVLMPNKDQVEVTAIYNEMEEEIPRAISGDNVRIRLRGVEDEDISPGFVLTSPSKPIHSVKQFRAELAILEHKSIICAGYSAVMHALLHYFDKATGRKSKKPPQVCQERPTAPVCVERFADYPQLGTIAIGKITKLIENPLDQLDEGVAALNVGAAN